jgi:hypothetical protein
MQVLLETPIPADKGTPIPADGSRRGSCQWHAIRNALSAAIGGLLSAGIGVSNNLP